MLRACVISGSLFGLGDVLAQHIDGSWAQRSWDAARTGKRAAFGFAVFGPASHAWYNVAAPRLVEGHSWRAVLTKAP
jgi:uncharacterized membrane protein YedE/YeeE